ncbi:MAG: hypothetical protein JST31_15535 [Actinobacteria bacterium]|nr:hypothetical protein [Actinomycetota bacterium]
MKGGDERNPGPKKLASSAASRVEAIIEGAERAAERVIDEAEANARDYLAEAEAEADRAVAARLAALGELSDDLVAQAEAIRTQSERLTASLREAKRLLEGEAGAATRERPDALDGAPTLTEALWPVESAGAGRRGTHLSAVEPEERRARPAAERGRGGTIAGARLLATQMAVSGSSREEIAARLRNGFENEDAEAILDAILGPEAEA